VLVTGFLPRQTSLEEALNMSAIQSISSPAPDLRAVPGIGALRPRRLRNISASGECPGQSILALLEEHAQQHPLNRALVMLDGEHAHAVTYMELAQRVKHLSARLSARFPEGGEPIAILSASGPSWGIVALAIIASRNVLIPLDPCLESDALSATLRRVAPAIVFTSAEHYEKVRAVASEAALANEILRMHEEGVDLVIPEASAAPARARAFKPTPGTAVMAFTSGTTATPKAVELSFDNLLFQIRALTRCFSLRPSDRLLSLLPMHHMLEFTAGFLCPLWSGAQVNYLYSLLPDEALARIRALSITRAVTVPAWLALLKRALERNAREGTNANVSPSALRSHARRAFGSDFEHFVCGGAALSDDIAEFFDTVGVPVVQGYGLTETCPVVATNTTAGKRRGSVGRPLTGTETGISPEGEILVRGPHVAGYYRLDGGSEQSVADAQGWFHTGDLGHLDADGFLYVTGRIKTTIVLASGKNVQPEEIEARLQACDGVAEAAVIALGEVNSARGEELCLVVVPAETSVGDHQAPNTHADTALEQRIRASLAALAPYKRPRRLILRDQALPRTTSGKLLRAELSEWARQQAATPS
jgi:long-chain acyl-CoA synthetase